MTKSFSSHMGVGRGRFRKAFRAVLLSRHGVPDAWQSAIQELGNACIYCGVSGDDQRLQLDHLWPESQGGCVVPGNMVPACPTCNSDRREIPWQEFFRTSPRVLNQRSDEEITQQIQRVTQYMHAHEQDQPPALCSMLNADEQALLKDFDLLLSALSDGALAQAGHIKKSSVKFTEPDRMFDELVRVARAFQKNSS
jgi:hypothetical protein